MMGYECVSLHVDEITSIKRQVLGDVPYLEQVSFALVVRLISMQPTRGDNHHVLFEINNLEQGIPTATKVAAQFKHAPLRPLWHKHFSSFHHTIQNIGLHWGIVEGNGNLKLDKMILEVARECGHDPEIWPKVATHRFVTGAMEERSADNKRTGDWIIFAKHDGQNYYLDLASHEEGQDGDRLMDKLKAGCHAEFPFVFDN